MPLSEEDEIHDHRRLTAKVTLDAMGEIGTLRSELDNVRSEISDLASMINTLATALPKMVEMQKSAQTSVAQRPAKQVSAASSQDSMRRSTMSPKQHVSSGSGKGEGSSARKGNKDVSASASTSASASASASASGSASGSPGGDDGVKEGDDSAVTIAIASKPGAGIRADGEDSDTVGALSSVLGIESAKGHKGKDTQNDDIPTTTTTNNNNNNNNSKNSKNNSKNGKGGDRESKGDVAGGAQLRQRHLKGKGADKSAVQTLAELRAALDGLSGPASGNSAAPPRAAVSRSLREGKRPRPSPGLSGKFGMGNSPKNSPRNGRAMPVGNPISLPAGVRDFAPVHETKTARYLRVLALVVFVYLFAVYAYPYMYGEVSKVVKRPSAANPHYRNPN